MKGYDSGTERFKQTEEKEKGSTMADRKQFLGTIKVNPELKKVLETSRGKQVTEEELQEQRISFAYGNVALENPAVTRESVRQVSAQMRVEGRREHRQGTEPR